MDIAIQKLSADFTSWYWWLTAIVLAVALNVASSYVKIGLDSYFAKRKGRASQKRIQRSAALHRQAVEMAAQHRVLQFEFQRETRMWLLATFLMLLALVLISSVALLNAFVTPAPAWLPRVLLAVGAGASAVVVLAFLVARELLWQVQKTFHAKGLLMQHSLEELRAMADEEHRKYYRLSENMRRVWPQ